MITHQEKPFGGAAHLRKRAAKSTTTATIAIVPRTHPAMVQLEVVVGGDIGGSRGEYVTSGRLVVAITDASVITILSPGLSNGVNVNLSEQSWSTALIPVITIGSPNDSIENVNCTSSPLTLKVDVSNVYPEMNAN